MLLDKGLDGGTAVGTASDFKGLRARDALDVVHAEGRIGGVPVLGDLRRIVRDWHGPDRSP